MCGFSAEETVLPPKAFCGILIKSEVHKIASKNAGLVFLFRLINFVLGTFSRTTKEK